MLVPFLFFQQKNWKKVNNSFQNGNTIIIKDSEHYFFEYNIQKEKMNFILHAKLKAFNQTINRTISVDDYYQILYEENNEAIFDTLPNIIIESLDNAEWIYIIFSNNFGVFYFISDLGILVKGYLEEKHLKYQIMLDLGIAYAVCQNNSIVLMLSPFELSVLLLDTDEIFIRFDLPLDIQDNSNSSIAIINDNYYLIAVEFRIYSFKLPAPVNEEIVYTFNSVPNLRIEAICAIGDQYVCVANKIPSMFLINHELKTWVSYIVLHHSISTIYSLNDEVVAICNDIIIYFHVHYLDIFPVIDKIIDLLFSCISTL